MKRISKYYILPAIALVLMGAVLGVNLDAYVSDDDAFQQLKKLERAFVLINRQYVDPIGSKGVAEEGIQGMLNELDPHSSYISADDVRDVRDNYRGSFGGIGIMYEVVDDTARVISPVTDGPSEKVGVMSGDRIVSIEDSTAIGLGTQGIQGKLKGPVGTKVDMTVYRPAVNKQFSYTITRDEIPLYSINTAYMVDDRTGYIEIDRFAMTTYDEFMDKMKTLKGQGMQRLVLDLRGNPGGVMRSAIEIADEMLASGMTLVATRGRESSMNNQYRATSGGIFEQQPVIVLVDRSSASASEIVTGALQDHDRALVVGQRTFGKALVQKQFELNDGSLLQMTVGRYYTPVGRLIQTPYEDGDRENYYEQKLASIEEATFNLSEYKESIPDSLSYQTDHGRTVFGGGGILPDYVVKPDTTSLRRFVGGSGLDFAFMVNWFPKNETQIRTTWKDRADEFRTSYTVPDDVMDAFWSYAEEQGMEFTTDPDSADPSEAVFPMQAKADADTFVRTRLKGFLSRQLYGSDSMRPILNQVDPTFQKAMSLWGESDKLAAFHSPSAPAVTNTQGVNQN